MFNSDKPNIKQVIVLYLKDPSKDDQYDEFIALVESAGMEIEDIYIQNRHSTSSHYFGEGYLEQVRDDLEQIEELKDVKLAIFSTQLTPLQYLNITNILPVDIMDKFELVLDIFDQRARSQETILQIQLARLQYSKAFEKSRLTGKVFGRFGTERRGFGATGQLKYGEYLADFRSKESTIKQKLKKIQQDRMIQRKNRKSQSDAENILRLALAGYTNAGKSSLLKALTDAKVEIADKMFTTLSPTTRNFYHNDLPVMVTDTVGFIQNLPPTLVKAFRSTLEESLETDYVLVVVDISEEIEEVERKLHTALTVLHDIGAKQNQIWIVFNKIDLVEAKDFEFIQEWFSNYLEDLDYSYPSCYISAKSGELLELLKLINQHRPTRRFQVLLPVELHTVRSTFHNEMEVLKEDFNDDQTVRLDIQTRRPSTFLKLLKQAKKLDQNVSYLEITSQ